ncbi:MAG: acyltransferase [Bacteroidia bacterium]|nr:acyltransferase [Bacteroidia bacterium]
MTKAWKGKTRGGAFGYRFFIGLIRFGGLTVAYTFLALVVVYFVPFAPRATQSTWRYARRILGYNRFKSVVLLFKNYYRLGQILIDKVALGLGMRKKYQFRFENYQPFLDVLNADTGVIMIGAHVGNWEIGVPFFNTYSRKINIVMYDAEHEKIKELLKKNGKTQEFKVIPVNQDNLTHVFKINEALNQKEYVCFQGDRSVNEEKTLRTSFMGQEAHFPMGPFLLAAKMKVPVVFYFAMREPHQTYRFHFFIPELGVNTKEKRAEQALLEAYAHTLENLMLRYPEQWFNYYEFWK